MRTRRVPSPRHLWLSAFLFVSAACAPDGHGALSNDGASPTEVGLALASGPWAFHYVTAALGNSWSRWWAFDADGTAIRTTERWVYDAATGESTYPRQVDVGRWSVTDGRRTEVVLAAEAGSDSERTWRFSAAVVDAAPRLVTHPTPAISGTERALSTRAFVLSDGGDWIDEHGVSAAGHPELDTWTRVVVKVEPPLSSSNAHEPCTFELDIEVKVGAETGTVTRSLPCARVSDPVSGWYAAGSVDDYIYRYDALDEVGALEGRSPAIRDALYDATVLVLAVHAEHPGVALHPMVSEEALGWYELDEVPTATTR